MNKIGFQNFRRFIDFKPIEYKGITFLVGRNNAGKSTLVKALLLINDFFKSGDISTFSFENKSLEDANIVTYGRAKNRKTKNDFINFYFQIDVYYVEIVISGEDDKTFAEVQNLLIIDTSKNLNFHFQPTIGRIDIFKGNVIDIGLDSEAENYIKMLNAEIEVKRNKIDAVNLKKSSKEYIFLLEELNTLQKKRDLISKEKEVEGVPYLYFIESDFNNGSSMKEIVDAVISDAIKYHDQEFPKIQNGAEPSKKFTDYRGIKEDALILESSFARFYDFVSVGYSALVYLGANPIKQSALFPIRDRNNALAQSIHDFYQLKILHGQPAYEFVKKWMKAFEVGDSFEIKIYAGEAYEVNIFSNDTEIHLADKGMGSIQAMLLIFRLAAIIHKNIGDSQFITVIIEEPELNLHPALQSKLAELLLECFEKYELNFIIETHSEYILRKSQVLVAEKEFEVSPNENPFCVYYFPKNIEQQPYQLEYQEDGSFNKNFGDGFFDEASSSTLQLLKIKRQKQA